MMKPALRSNLLLLLLPLFLFGALALLRAEWRGVKIAWLLNSGKVDVEASTLKPVDRLALKTEELLPKDARAFFFNPFPSNGPKGGFYEMRLRYQLYPRKLVVIDPGQEFDFKSIQRGDFVLFINPAEEPYSMERDMRSAFGLVELYSRADNAGMVSLYRVASGI